MSSGALEPKMFLFSRFFAPPCIYANRKHDYKNQSLLLLNYEAKKAILE
jgi:hypothetical protein